MKTIRNIISILLMVCLVAAGISLPSEGDIYRDGDVDLADAIVSVRQIVLSASDKAVFRAGMENTLMSLSVVAGLKSAIKADREMEYQSNGYGFMFLALIPDYNSEVLPMISAPAIDRPFLYASPILVPLTPPPLCGLVS